MVAQVIKTINAEEVGLGLEIPEGVLKAKIDPVEGNALTVTEAGLKVVVPEAERVEVPTALSGATRADNTITFKPASVTADAFKLSFCGIFKSNQLLVQNKVTIWEQNRFVLSH